LVYEQDWLSTVWDSFNAIKQDVNLGRNWLLEMGNSAAKYDLTIQYCMAYPRYFLQSLEIPAVTQIRASGDYHQSNTQWQIGDSSLLAHAVGLAPFKDDFRTTTDAQHCANSDVEQWPELETAVAIFSAGPVGPSDHIDNWNRTLIMKTCMDDGKLLQPSMPAMSIDSTYVYRAFASGGPNGQVWDAVTDLDGFLFHYVLVINLNATYSLTVDQLNGPTIPNSVTFEARNPSALALFDASHPLSLAACGKIDFQIHHIVPAFSNGWALLGELNKFVSVSEDRFVNIDVQGSNGFTVGIRGAPGETVSISATPVSAWKISTFNCKIPASGTANLQIPSGTCF